MAISLVRQWLGFLARINEIDAGDLATRIGAPAHLPVHASEQVICLFASCTREVSSSFGPNQTGPLALLHRPCLYAGLHLSEHQVQSQSCLFCCWSNLLIKQSGSQDGTNYQLPLSDDSNRRHCRSPNVVGRTRRHRHRLQHDRPWCRHTRGLDLGGANVQVLNTRNP